jgi:hypothetical protein
MNPPTRLLSPLPVYLLFSWRPPHPPGCSACSLPPGYLLSPAGYFVSWLFPLLLAPLLFLVTLFLSWLPPLLPGCPSPPGYPPFFPCSPLRHLVSLLPLCLPSLLLATFLFSLATASSFGCPFLSWLLPRLLPPFPGYPFPLTATQSPLGYSYPPGYPLPARPPFSPTGQPLPLMSTSFPSCLLLPLLATSLL